MTVSGTVRITQWNADTFQRRARAILDAYRPRMNEQLRQEIQRSQFSWPRETRRRNGQRVGSPRDIVDTGAFLGSQRSYRTAPLQLRYAWGGSGGVNYAGIILRGKANYPARDWISPALVALPPGTFFANEWRRLS